MTPVTTGSPCSRATQAPLLPIQPLEPVQTASREDPHCVVCGTIFKAQRLDARCCSGRCRIQLSRSRRVADLVARLVKAEAALVTAEQALHEAAVVLRDVRELAEAGGPKVAP